MFPLYKPAYLFPFLYKLANLFPSLYKPANLFPPLYKPAYLFPPLYKPAYLFPSLYELEMINDAFNLRKCKHINNTSKRGSLKLFKLCFVSSKTAEYLHDLRKSRSLRKLTVQKIFLKIVEKWFFHISSNFKIFFFYHQVWFF